MPDFPCGIDPLAAHCLHQFVFGTKCGRNLLLEVQVPMNKATGLGIQVPAKHNRYHVAMHDEIHKGSQFCHEIVCLAQFDILIVWVRAQVCGADDTSRSHVFKRSNKAKMPWLLR